MKMEVKYQLSYGTLTLYMYGELDEYSSSNVKRIIDKVVYSNSTSSKVIFDLSGVTFMDSTGIGLLIGRYKTLKELNIPTFITGTNVSTEKVIQLSGLYKIMPKI